MKFARDATEPAFAARDMIAGKDAGTLATEVLAMDDEQFRTTFRKSPMKRAKLAGLQRNARVVLGHGHVQDKQDASRPVERSCPDRIAGSSACPTIGLAQSPANPRSDASATDGREEFEHDVALSAAWSG
ncbi:MAG TPA: hypothetical protein VGT98_08085 [Candidatus Elarobacter sp.]|nr:hypothetical protein [Candidatus Elarobacter sp.]